MLHNNKFFAPRNRHRNTSSEKESPNTGRVWKPVTKNNGPIELSTSNEPIPHDLEVKSAIGSVEVSNQESVSNALTVAPITTKESIEPNPNPPTQSLALIKGQKAELDVNNTESPSITSSAYKGEYARNYQELRDTIVNSSYLQGVSMIYNKLRRYPLEFQDLGAVELMDRKQDKVSYLLPGSHSNQIMELLTSFFFSNTENLHVIITAMEKKSKDAAGNVKPGLNSTVEKTITPPCLSVVTVNIKGQLHAYIALSSFAHEPEIMQVLQNFVDAQNNSKPNIEYHLLGGDTGNYSRVVNSTVSVLRNKPYKPLSGKCIEWSIGSLLTKLFLEYGKDARIIDSVTVDFFPYKTKPETIPVKVSAPDYRYGRLDLSNGHSLPIKPACESCKVVKIAALTVWKCAQDIGGNKLTTTKKHLRSTSPTSNSYYSGPILKR